MLLNLVLALTVFIFFCSILFNTNLDNNRIIPPIITNPNSNSIITFILFKNELFMFIYVNILEVGILLSKLLKLKPFDDFSYTSGAKYISKYEYEPNEK